MSLGIYDTPVENLENFEADGDSLACTVHAMKQVAKWEEANCD